MGYGLGRRHAPDKRDAAHTMRSATISMEPQFPYRYWSYGERHLDQGNQPHCVGYAWSHFLECAPIQHPEVVPLVDPDRLYYAAQKVDEWLGESYDGTSVRAGAKVLQAEGFIGEYLWGFSLDEVVRHIWTTGPVVVGLNWYDGMFYPDSAGFVSISGHVVGGHAFLLEGVNMSNRTCRALNSWGEDFGVARGRFRMSFSTLERLLSEDGDACFALERSQ